MPLTADEIEAGAIPAGGAPQPEAVIDLVSNVSPDDAARTRETARTLDLDEQAVGLDPTEFARQARVKQTDPRSFGPVLRQMAANPQYAAIIQDDFPNLQQTETLLDNRNFAEKSRDLLHSMVLDIGTSTAALMQEAFENAGTDSLSDPGQIFKIFGSNPLVGARQQLPEEVFDKPAEFFGRIAQSGASRSQELMPQFQSVEANAVAGGLKSAANFVTLMLLTRGQALVPMALESKGLSYQRAREQGMEPGEAGLYSTIQGSVEYATEKLPFDMLVKGLGKDSLVKLLRNQLMVEMPSEQVATLLQDFTDWAMLPENDEVPARDFFAAKPRLLAAYETAIATAVGTGAQTTLLHTVDRITRTGEPAAALDAEALSEAQRLVESETDQARIDGLIKLAQESKVNGRAQDAYREFLQGAGSDQKVYIAADVIGALETEGTAIPSQLLPQDSLGGDVEIPMDVFMTAAADPANAELLAALRPHVRMGLDRYSAQEIEQGGSANVQRLLEKAKISADARTEIDEYRDWLTERLTATGTMDTNSARRYADLHEAMILTAAERYKVAPGEVINRMRFDVAGMGDAAPGATVLTQDDGPESDAWKAAVAKGLDVSTEARMQRAREMGFDTDQVWYHGTSDDIPRFSLGKAQSRDSGFIGRGIYVSSSPSIASSYANMAVPVERQDDGTFPDPNVLPLLVSTQNTKRYSLAEKIEMAEKARADEFFSQDLTNELERQGYDSAEVVDVNGDVIEKVIFDPSNIRSVNAAFDPDQKDSAKLLAQQGKRRQSLETLLNCVQTRG